MKKDKAIQLVQQYFNEKKLDKKEKVLVYSSSFQKTIVKYFNHLKYKKSISFLRKIEISAWIKPDVEILDYLVINKKGSYETSYFWIIYWGPVKFIEENDIRHGLIGPGPIVICKKTARLFHTSTSNSGVLDKIENGQNVDLKLLEHHEIEIGKSGNLRSSI